MDDLLSGAGLPDWAGAINDLLARAALPEWAGAMNAVDAVLLVALGLFALDGMRRGFVAGTLAILGAAATLVAALRGYPWVAGWINERYAWPPLLANVAGFLAVLVVAHLAVTLLVRLLLALFRPVRRLLGPLALLDHLLGLAPGLLQGLIVAALVLTPLYLFPISAPLAEAINQSALASRLARQASAMLPPLEQLAGQLAGTGLVFRTRIIQPEEGVRLPAQANPVPDPAAETSMLDLVNEERARAGLRPLVMDEGLRAVARRHSEEMFRLGYFAHTSPVSGTLPDRLRRAGIAFDIAGENIAYAPAVEVAHSGLMASPGHRANILAPHFTRVGIGVMSAGLHGRMFTQDFAG
jgi:uncharacterized protein YkwD